MTDDPAMLRADAAEAARAVEALAREGEAAAAGLQEAFEEAGAAIAEALEDAARSGEFSFRAMAEAIARDLAALALDRLFDAFPDDWTGRTGQSAGAALGEAPGQRVEGGPVIAGARELAGDREADVFTAARAVHPAAAPVVNVTINAGADAAEGVRRSERQIAAAVARAASRGSRLI